MRLRSSAFHNKLEWVVVVLEDQLSTELERGVREPNLRYGWHNACHALNRVSRSGWRQPFQTKVPATVVTEVAQHVVPVSNLQL